MFCCAFQRIPSEVLLKNRLKLGGVGDFTELKRLGYISEDAFAWKETIIINFIKTSLEFQKTIHTTSITKGDHSIANIHNFPPKKANIDNLFPIKGENRGKFDVRKG